MMLLRFYSDTRILCDTAQGLLGGAEPFYVSKTCSNDVQLFQILLRSYIIRQADPVAHLRSRAMRRKDWPTSFVILHQELSQQRLCSSRAPNAKSILGEAKTISESQKQLKEIFGFRLSRKWLLFFVSLTERRFVCR